MPLTSGNSKKTISNNIGELHSGPNFAKTEAKFGKKKADKQAVAIALSNARKTAARADGGPIGLMSSGGLAGLVGMPGGMNQLAKTMGGMGAPQPSEGVAGAFAVGGTIPNRAVGGFNVAKSANLTPGFLERQNVKSLTKGPILSAVPGRTDHHFTHVPSGSYVIPADIVSGRGQGNTIAGSASLSHLFNLTPYGGAGPKIARGAGAPRAAFPKAPKLKRGGGKEGNPSNMGVPVRVNLAGGEIVVPPESLLEVVHPNLKTAHQIMDAWVLKERKKLRKTLAKLPGPVRS